MNASPLKAYLNQVVIVTLVALVAGGAFFYLYPQYYFSLFPYLVLFFMVSTLTIHYLLSSATNLKPQRFISHFMMVTGGKFFLYLIILAIVAFNIPKTEIPPFAISFFIFYLVFSIVEIKSVLSHLRQDSKEEKEGSHNK